MADDDLADFERDAFAHGGKERTVFRKGTGPAVIVMAEMPGITPKVAGFARRVAAIGCTAVMPHLFGKPGKDPARRRAARRRPPTALSTIVPLCVSREFTTWATNRTSPVDRVAAGPRRPRARALRRSRRRRHRDVLHRRLRAGDGDPPEPARAGAVAAVDADGDDEDARSASIDCSPDDLDVVKGRCAAEGLDGARPALQGRPVRAGRALRRSSASSSATRSSPSSWTTSRQPRRRDEAALGADRAPHRRARPADPRRLDQVLDLFRTRLLARPPDRPRQHRVGDHARRG